MGLSQTNKQTLFMLDRICDNNFSYYHILFPEDHRSVMGWGLDSVCKYITQSKHCLAEFLLVGIILFSILLSSVDWYISLSPETF